jgi:hypothetical protein
VVIGLRVGGRLHLTNASSRKDENATGPAPENRFCRINGNGYRNWLESEVRKTRIGACDLREAGFCESGQVDCCPATVL